MKIPEPRKLPSGSWFIQLRINGQSISITEDDEDVCIAKAMAYKTGLLKARKKPEEITVKQAITKYIESRRSIIAASSIQGYEKIRDNDFPELMEKKLPKLTRADLEEAVEKECARESPRTGKKLSAKTVNCGYMLISTVLHKFAPDLDTAVKLPELKRKPVMILEPETVYNAVKGSSVELPVLLSMWLSLSMSEIRGLTKSKSIRDGKLSVVETVVDIDGKPVRKVGGKEENRSRTLELPEYLQKMIDAVPGDVLIPETAQTISKRFYRLLDKAGLPHINFHKLRHINATVMSSLGIPEQDANDRGGWKTDYVRKRVYTHSFTEQRKASDQKIDAYFEKIIANGNANGNEES